MILRAWIERRTANEIFLKYAMNGTSTGTFSATDTLGVVDNCKVVVNVYSTVFAGALTFTASDTTV